ncbi:hypothetical protein KSF_087290 [Reticulibacter mediterranei]|uniref:Uncharacterized protein n=1 Tax=Reticulibacter mediterranei TaxID=2778369 RepID=A0A8J3IQ36_9CHLR|nr:hypothetical protein KSF_087290 [Reticulibacter mediterranei]
MLEHEAEHLLDKLEQVSLGYSSLNAPFDELAHVCEQHLHSS